jgi:hypothetical protein
MQDDICGAILKETGKKISNDVLEERHFQHAILLLMGQNKRYIIPVFIATTRNILTIIHSAWMRLSEEDIEQYRDGKFLGIRSSASEHYLAWEVI